MKTNDILTLLLLSCMLVGCQECEDDSFVVSRMKCEMEGIPCESKYKWNLIASSLAYHSYFVNNEKMFLLRIDAHNSDEKREQTGVHLIELSARFPEQPQLGKKYPLMNLCDIDWDNLPETVCWARLICAPEIGEDTRFPEETHNRLAVIRTDRSSGYIIFDEINMTSNDGLVGTVSGRFEFVAEGENDCYPEIKMKVSVTNGLFSYSVDNWVDSEALPLPLMDLPYGCIVD